MRLEPGAPESAISAVSRLGRLAHHPDCARYAHHLLRIRGRALCLGCACMSMGGVAGLAVTPLLLASLPPLAVLAVSVALVAPTALQPFVQRKPYKVMARTLLGAGTALYACTVLWALPWSVGGLLARMAAGGVFLVTYRAMLALRERRLDNPCATCPYGQKPFCGHYLPAFEKLARSASDPSDRELARGLVESMRASGIRPLP